MELAFNAAWLVVAIASYGLLVKRIAIRGADRAQGTNRLRLFVSLTCALAILFPVISLSDDLQEMQAAVVEISLPRLVIKKFGANDPSKLEQRLYHPPFVVASVMTGVGWAIPEGIAAQQTGDSVTVLQQPMPSRAPPFFLIAQSR